MTHMCHATIPYSNGNIIRRHLELKFIPLIMHVWMPPAYRLNFILIPWSVSFVMLYFHLLNPTHVTLELRNVYLLDQLTYNAQTIGHCWWTFHDPFVCSPLHGEYVLLHVSIVSIGIPADPLTVWNVSRKCVDNEKRVAAHVHSFSQMNLAMIKLNDACLRHRHKCWKCA